MDKPDILMFLSDQHHAMYTGFAGHKLVKTPNLDRIAEEGTVFEAAYTSYPLCVPARTSFLTGQLASSTGVFGNCDALPGDHATFIHSLAAEGYETVLCGRMHFRGEDQRHGFTKRIMGDILPGFWTPPNTLPDFHPYGKTVAVKNCLDVIGGGNSPVLEYDRAVIKAAIDYLQQKHEKPQCIVVGTYAPHFPFVCPPDLFNYYRENASLPVNVLNEPDYSHPLIKRREQRTSNEKMLGAAAAYMGMVTNLDMQIGSVHDAWEKYLCDSGRKGLFIYFSDHGEQVGEHYMYGKLTFFEGSARIPMVFKGDGIKEGNKITEPVSIMDLGVTLCSLTGSLIPPDQDGKSIVNQITKGKEDNGRYVISEYVEKPDGRVIPGRMIRKGKWKFISYHTYDKYDLLFNIEQDPCELHNAINEQPEIAWELKKLLVQNWDIKSIQNRVITRLKHQEILSKWSRNSGVKDKDRWIIPECARKLPDVT